MPQCVRVDRFGVGSVVYMEYTSPSGPGRKTMNLKDRNGNIVLHVNPRYDPNWRCLVLNTNLGGWQREENHSHFPMQPNTNVVIAVHAYPDGFEISSNMRQFVVKFAYRPQLPVENVCEIEGQDDVKISYGKFLYNSEPGSTVYVHGTATSDYSVNFQPGYPGAHDMNEILFHFNPRFSQNTVVRNTKSSNCWGGEERDGGLPVALHTPTNLTFTMQAAGFEVGVNGYHYTTYRHRTSMQGNMTMFIIDGMSNIQSVDYFPNH